jgi:hypothetical protein
MPIISTLFSPDRRIDRPIESVITYGRDREDALRTEVSEYYVTSHINDGLRKLLEGMQRGSGEVGVWVSGFYGSGKSSFSKYLGFALDGKRLVGTEPFRKLLAQRLTDEATKALLNSVANSFNPYVLMVDLGSDQLAGQSEQRISDILYHKVLQALGYPGDRKLAQFVMRLEADGKLDDFLARVKAENRSWKDVMNVSMVALPLASRIAHQLYPADYATPTALSAMRLDQQLTQREQAVQMIELIRKKTGRDNVLLILDEAGHFVSIGGEKLVLDLKGFAEVIKDVGQGKVWIMATAQQTLMEEEHGKMALNTENLYKLRDRFPLGVHLEASDIKEITYQRLLSKSPQGEQALKHLWATHFAGFRLATSLENAGDLQRELQEKDFVDLYPFLPSTFEILVLLLGRLAKKTGGTGLRSAIKVVQEIMTSGVTRMGNREVGQMVTAADLYDALVNEIRPSFGFLAQGIDDVAMVFPGKEAHLRVAKAIAILQVLGLVHATSRNIAAVLCPSLTAGDALRREVEAVLADFEQDARVRIRPGQHGAYIFLSGQATGLQQTFDDIQPEASAVTQLITRTVFKAMHEDLPQATAHGAKTIKVALEVMSGENYINIAGGNEAVHLRVRFVSSAMLDSALTEVQQDSSRPGQVAMLTLVATRQDSHLELARDIARCQRFLDRFTGHQPPEVNDFLQVITHRKERAEQDLVSQYTQALRAAPVFAHGLRLSVDATVPRLTDALAKLLASRGEHIYAEYPKAKANVPTRLAEDFLRCEIGTITLATDPLRLVQRSAGAAQIDREHPALVSLLHHLKAHGASTGKELLKAFEAPPFGWSPDTIRYLVAGLLHGGLIELRINGQSHRTPSNEVVQSLASTAGFRDVGVRTRDNAPDIQTTARVVERLAELTGNAVMPNETAIAKAVRNHVPELLPRYGSLATSLETLGCASHARAQSLADRLKTIVSADGTEIIPELGPVRSTLFEEWTWVRRVEVAFTAEVRGVLESARSLESFAWPVGVPEFEPVRAEAATLISLAKIHREDEQAEGAFDGLRAAAAGLVPLWSRMRDAVETAFQAKVAETRRRLEEQPGWADLDTEQRGRLLAQVTPATPAERVVGADLCRDWLLAYGEVASRHVQAQGELERLSAEARVRRAEAIARANQAGGRNVNEFRLRLPRLLDSAEKIEELRRQLAECERRLATENLRIETEFLD